MAVESSSFGTSADVTRTRFLPALNLKREGLTFPVGGTYQIQGSVLCHQDRHLLGLVDCYQ